jgi:hypothetical protein
MKLKNHCAFVFIGTYWHLLLSSLFYEQASLASVHSLILDKFSAPASIDQ